MTTLTRTYLDELVEASKVAARQAKHETTTEDVADAVATRVLRDVGAAFAARPELRDATGQVLAASVRAWLDTWAAGKGLDLTEEK